LQIVPVRSRSEFDRFIEVAFTVYRDFPNWVPPLKSSVRKTLTPGQNPFWNRAERELFIATEDGRDIGRIAAIVDSNYNRYRSTTTGFFGFFECLEDDSAAAALFEAAAQWCRARGMNRMLGPTNPSANDEAGLLIEGFNSPPFIKMSFNPEYYVDMVEAAGFRKAKDLYAYIAPVKKALPEKLTRVIDKLKRRKGIRVRLVDLKRLKSELEVVKDIYNDAWADNWDFAPMSDDEIDDLAAQLKPLAEPVLLPIVEYRGEPAAMAVGLPDYNQVLHHLNGRLAPFGWLKFLIQRRRITQLRVWALGVKRKFQGLGLDALLYYESRQGANKLGYDWAEVSWILEDNEAIIRPITMMRGRRYKTYRMYDRAL
jgi:GNAT superfamily N-acetyltransferase